MPGFNYNMTGYNYNDNLITASIGSDGTIYQESMSAGRVKIGVDNQTVKEMQEAIDNYYNKLVELGVIVPEKTQEEIAQENAKQQKEMLEMIKNLKDEIKELKSNGNVRYDNTEGSTNVEQESSRNKSSNKSSEKDNSGND